MATWEAQVGPYKIEIEDLSGTGRPANDPFVAALIAMEMATYYNSTATVKGPHGKTLPVVPGLEQEQVTHLANKIAQAMESKDEGEE